MSYWSRGNNAHGESDCDSIEEENYVENPDLTAKFAPNASSSRRFDDQSMAQLGDQSHSYHIDMGQYVVQDDYMYA